MKINTVLVTGGAGYVGAVLVPKLLSAGYRVRVLDLFLYGEDVFKVFADRSLLEIYKGDIRDQKILKLVVPDCDAVIHLACVSNDPSFELDPDLGKSINYDAFRPLVEIARDSHVQRFIYASSSSVYGIKEEEHVTEDLPLDPLTGYSKYKALCEDILQEYQSPKFTTVTLRPATICGYSPRLRLDLTVNLLTNHAISNKLIRVFGGSQYRPNLHIEDMTDLYLRLLELPRHNVAGKVWNVGYDNLKVSAIAELVQEVIGTGDTIIKTEDTDDLRSYRVSSAKIRNDICFVARRTVHDAIRELYVAFKMGKVPNPMTDDRYYNLRTMQSANLK